MRYQIPAIALVLLAVLAGAAGPATAHETRTVEGYDVTFGGAEEPLITGERMWLEVEIVDNESGEPVTGQAETLRMYVQNEGNERGEINLSEAHGENGVYEAPVVFTEPGEYVVHLEGSIGDAEVHTHFETEVHDRSEIEYPGAESQTVNSNDDSRTDDNQTEAAVFGFDSVAVAVMGIVGFGCAFLTYRQR